jgi:hypothetical protein
MNLAPLRSLVREVNFGAHGVDAMVTIPDGAPVSTKIIWLTPVTEQRPAGSEFGRSEAIRSMAIRRDVLPAVPRGSTIAVTEHLLSSPTMWTVDGMEAVFSDHQRVIVVPYDEQQA